MDVDNLRARLGGPAKSETQTSDAPEPQAETEVHAEPEPAHQPVTEPAPAPDPAEKPITKAQVTKLNILLKEEGLNDRAAKLQYRSEQMRRPIQSSNELTFTEAHDLIEFLERSQAEDKELAEGQQLPVDGEANQ